MKDKEYVDSENLVASKLYMILNHQYGPSHIVDLLQECIKILQPYAEKEKEKTHA